MPSGRCESAINTQSNLNAFRFQYFVGFFSPLFCGGATFGSQILFHLSQFFKMLISYVVVFLEVIIESSGTRFTYMLSYSRLSLL